MDALSKLFSGFGLCLFGIAAVLLTIFLLRLLRRLDRIISMAEIGASDQIPRIVRKLLGK